MFKKICILVLLNSLALSLSAQNIQCKKRENNEAIFSMDTEKLEGVLSTVGLLLAMKCRDDGHNSYRCYLQSERDPLHSYEVIISQESRYIEHYARNFWAYPLICNSN